jgi:hypothetical protein
VVQALVADLASPEASRRIEATARLVEQREFRLRDIEKLLESRDLHPEQRQRLLNIAMARFYSEPRAGLGFETDGQAQERGVGVRNVVAGFPAAGVLQAGDRIMAVNGVQLPNFAAIRPIIVSHDPGDVLALSVIRGGETLNLRVPLGSFNQLRNSMLDQSVLASAWELRSRRLRGQPAGPIASGLGLTDWVADDPESIIRILEVGPRGRMTEEGEAGVVIGGEPRGDAASSVGQARWDAGIPIHRAGLERVAPLQDFENLERERLLRMARRDAIDVQLAMPNLPPALRQALEEQRRHLQMEITSLEMLAEQRRRDQIRRDR